MLNTLFTGLFDSELAATITVGNFLLCIGVSLVIGLALALAYGYRSRTTKSFAMTLALLPAVVCVVIMMVNGNIGTGVAVAGTFGLVRFRSAPGTAKEISAIFLAMAAGLMTGMGYLGYACLFTAIFSLLMMLYTKIDLGGKNMARCRTLHITVPEDLDYTGAFADLLDAYTAEHTLTQVKTSNMGSLFRLTYDVTLKDAGKEKEFIDELRVRNGNLEISISAQETMTNEL